MNRSIAYQTDVAEGRSRANGRWDPRKLAGSNPLALWLVPGVLFLCAIGVKLATFGGAASAFLFQDEALYKAAAFGFAHGDPSQVLRVPYPPLYPLVIAPAFSRATVGTSGFSGSTPSLRLWPSSLSG
jgi:hypothetical protein